ncbi:hypothetical protein ACLB2K_062920 [Fragaria x ananassa]
MILIVALLTIYREYRIASACKFLVREVAPGTLRLIKKSRSRTHPFLIRENLLDASKSLESKGEVDFALSGILNYVTYCSVAYWSLDLLQIPVTVAVTSYEVIKLSQGKRILASKGSTTGKNWRVYKLVSYCACGIAAVLVGGLLGLGGGFIMGPLFLEMGIPAQLPCLVFNSDEKQDSINNTTLLLIGYGYNPQIYTKHLVGNITYVGVKCHQCFKRLRRSRGYGARASPRRKP